MEAGVCSRDITPVHPVDLSGYIGRKQPSTGVLDPLHARVVFLCEGDARLLWIHVDVLGLTREHVLRLKKRMSMLPCCDGIEIVISAAHTHAAPVTLPLRGCGNMDADYVAMLDDAVTECGLDAMKDVEPVGLWFGEGQCGLGCDRTSAGPHQHTDSRLPALCLRRKDLSIVAVIANYPMHNVALSSENRMVSADVAGVAASHLEAALPESPLVMLTNGACGNINPLRMSSDPDVMRAQGRELGENILNVVASAKPVEKAGLAVRRSTVELPLDVMTADRLDEEYRIAMERMKSSPSCVKVVKEWYDESRRLLEKGAPSSVLTDVCVIRLGDISLVAVGAEVFSRMADELREVGGARTYVVGYAEGCVGYVPFAEMYDVGGYEVEDACKFYGNFMIARGGYELLRSRAAALLETEVVLPHG